MSDEKKCGNFKRIGFILLVINTVLLSLILLKLCCMSSSKCGLWSKKGSGFCPYSKGSTAGSVQKGS